MPVNTSSAERADILIIGAGPTGLAAALFLAERGHRPRIVEKARERSPYSKAFGVNARTLDLLSASGVTERFLANGRRLTRLNLRRDGRVLATLRLDEVEHRFPCMVVQSQASSERILEGALGERGITVERGIEVAGVCDEDGRARVDAVERNAEGHERRLTIKASVVLAADGAASGVRKGLGIAFDGEAYDEPWRLYDVELDGPLDPDEAHILLLDKGGMFVVRHEGRLWRVLGNAPDLLDRLPRGTKVGEVQWTSEFGIANRVAARFAAPPVYLAGDAAHIHSGIGARGMNLGIEDAYVFAALYDGGALYRYDALRRPTVEAVVGQIKRAMAVPRPGTLPGRVVRSAPWLVSLVQPIVRHRVERWVLGLDHDLGV